MPVELIPPNLSLPVADARYLGLAGGTLTGDVVGASPLTAGSIAVGSSAVISRAIWSRFDWTNADIVALGAALTGDITVCTLPAKTVVRNALMVLTGQAAGTTTLTGAVGITAAAYIDYIVASDLKAAANTPYGNLAAARGALLTGFNMPSFTTATVVKMHLIATVANLSAVTGSSGSIYLETITLP